MSFSMVIFFQKIIQKFCLFLESLVHLDTQDNGMVTSDHGIIIRTGITCKRILL